LNISSQILVDSGAILGAFIFEAGPPARLFLNVVYMNYPSCKNIASENNRISLNTISPQNVRPQGGHT
jgi:hypothetical protein